MYTLRRTIARTDGPQPVYTAVLPTEPSVAQLVPATVSGASYWTPRTRPSYDVRLNDGSGGSFGVPLDQSAVWQAAFDAQRSATTPDRVRLDVRQYEWTPEHGWLFAAQTPPSTVAQQWPAVLLGTGLSYRSVARAGIDVRTIEQPIFSWPQPLLDRTVRTWIPVFTTALQSERVRNHALLDVRRQEWSPSPSSWIELNLPTGGVSVPEMVPAFVQAADLSYRTRMRPPVDIRIDSVIVVYGSPFVLGLTGDVSARLDQVTRTTIARSVTSTVISEG